MACVVGALLGAVNGWLIMRFSLPPIVVTLGTLSAYRGATFVASGGAWISDHEIHPVINGALPVIQVSPFWQQAIAGAVILISVVLNARADRTQGRQILETPQGAQA